MERIGNSVGAVSVMAFLASDKRLFCLLLAPYGRLTVAIRPNKRVFGFYA